MMFRTAIVKKPGKELIHGITTADLGKPDFKLAIRQHLNYVNTLRECGLKVTELSASDNYPDSVFIEDTALCTPHCAIIMRPGALSRRGEEKEVIDTLKTFYTDVLEIESPGTIEAGDIMMIGSHYFIGISDRTNKQGAQQLIRILNRFGMTASTIELKEFLHLKTGVSYLENNTLLVYGEFADHPEFARYKRIGVPADEAYAANSLWVNGNVLVPMGFPKTRALIQSEGYRVLEVDVSEFQKLDGGLSCLSLRF